MQNNDFYSNCSNITLYCRYFDGNTDGNTIVTSIFPRPVTANFVRINPYEWGSHIGLRFELLGCYIKGTVH